MPSDRYKRIARKTTFINGSAELSTSSAIHNHPTTLGFGSTLLWLTSKAGSPPPIVTHNNNLKGPLVGIEAGTVTEYFGLGIPQMLLAPSLAIARILDLKTGPILDGLTLLDEKGQKAIVARTWRTKFVRSNDFGPAYPLIEGMDVLIRPDLLEILEKNFSPNIIYFWSRHTEFVNDESG
jgi:hypothetical protein